MNVTLQEIANKANCSKTTVSLVLNEKKNHNISKELCGKIRSIAKRNNYKKKQIASSSNIVALVFPKALQLTTSPYYSGMLKGISCFLNQKGYVTTGVYRDEHEQDDWFLDNPILAKSAGVVLCEPPTDAFLEFLEIKNIPLLTLNFKLPGYPLVGSDIFEATMTAMTYLKEKGIKSVGFIGSERHPVYVQYYQFFLSGASYNEINFDKKHLFYTSAVTNECYKAIRAFLDEHKASLPDVLVCANEGIAGYTMKALQDAGFSIPEDVGLLAFGYGNHPFPFVPSLSLIQIMNEKEGQFLGRIIYDCIKDKDEMPDWNCLVPGEFVIGDSC